MTTSKTISNPRKSTSSWVRVRALGRYVIGLDIDADVEKCLAYRCHGFLSDEPLKQIYEMQIFAQASLHSPDPIHHQVVSVTEDEDVSVDKFYNIVDEYIKFYNFEQHQIISGLHQDTENLHIHFAVNRYNHYTDKVVSINNGFDRQLGALFCAHLEAKFDFSMSKNAAAYCIGDRYVLSDLYNVDSAAAHIKDNEIKINNHSKKDSSIEIKDISVRSILGRDIPPILKKAKSWSNFILALNKVGIDIVGGQRGGLLYNLYLENQAPIFVAASRVSKNLTRKNLENWFGQPFPKNVERSVNPRSTSWYAKLIKPMLSHRGENTMPAANYARYSEPKPGKVDLEAEVQNALTRLASVFTSGHVMFRKTFADGGARTHVIDRVRGDPSPLHMSELSSFTANIAAVTNAKYEVDFVSPADADVVTLIGPADTLPALHDRGLFPNVVQTSPDNTSRFLFSSVTSLPDPDVAQREITAALEDIPDLQRAPNNLVEIARDGQVLDFEMMNAPACLQFLGPIVQRIAKLHRSINALSQTLHASHLMRRGVSRHINAALTQKKGQYNNDIDRRSLQSPVDGYAGTDRPLRQAANRALCDDTSAPAADPATGRERNRRASGHAGVTDDYVSEAVGSVQNDSGGLQGNGTEARDKDQHAARVRVDHSQPSDDAQPEAGAEQIELRFRVPRPDNQYWRMLRATLIAEKHGLETAWSDKNPNEIQILSASKSEIARYPICLLTVTAIKDLDAASDRLLNELATVFELPVLPPPQPIPQNVSQTRPIAGKEKLTSDPVTPLHPETVHQIIYDPEHLLDANDVGTGQILINSTDEIGSLNLSNQVDLLIPASDMFKPQLVAEVKAIEAAIIARKIELLKTEIYVPKTSLALEPRAILFVVDASDELVNAEWHEDVLVVPIGTDGTIVCSEPVCFNAVQKIVFNFPLNTSENQHSVIDDLRSQLGYFTTAGLIDISETFEDYKDTINILKDDDGTSPGF